MLGPHTQARTAAAAGGLTCTDCYFRRHGLCALTAERPCPTFRPAGTSLQPPRQAMLVPRPLGAVA